MTSAKEKIVYHVLSIILGVTTKDKRTMWNPMEVTWTTRYSATLNKLWLKLPEWLGSTLITLIVFVFGVSIKGDWIIVAVHLMKQIGYYCKVDNLPENLYGNCSIWSGVSLEKLYLKDLSTFWVYSSAVAYGAYFTLGGFLHWYFYVRQRDRPEEWKCQPHKWLTPELELHEIALGSISLLCTNTFSAVIACYISNGGWSMVYYGFLDYGWFWLLIQAVFIFIYQDYITYWLHRCYHMPFLYKNFHKLHHKYKQPTAFSVTAIHPVEIVSIQLVLCLPLFVCPVHWLPFYVVALYTYYHGIMDHSGIDFKAPWWQPWRPDTMFHDNHHQYFHVNFSFNIYYWDILHGTHRRPDRIYRENIFYGKGKPLEDASENEILEEIDERLGENPNAHRSNVNYFLSEKVCQKVHENNHT